MATPLIIPFEIHRKYITDKPTAESNNFFDTFKNTGFMYSLDAPFIVALDSVQLERFTAGRELSPNATPQGQVQDIQRVRPSVINISGTQNLDPRNSSLIKAQQGGVAKTLFGLSSALTTAQRTLSGTADPLRLSNVTFNVLDYIITSLLNAVRNAWGIKFINFTFAYNSYLFKNIFTSSQWFLTNFNIQDDGGNFRCLITLTFQEVLQPVDTIDPVGGITRRYLERVFF